MYFHLVKIVLSLTICESTSIDERYHSVAMWYCPFVLNLIWTILFANISEHNKSAMQLGIFCVTLWRETERDTQRSACVCVKGELWSVCLLYYRVLSVDDSIQCGPARMLSLASHNTAFVWCVRCTVFAARVFFRLPTFRQLHVCIARYWRSAGIEWNEKAATRFAICVRSWAGGTI